MSGDVTLTLDDPDAVGMDKPDAARVKARAEACEVKQDVCHGGAISCHPNCLKPAVLCYVHKASLQTSTFCTLLSI